AVPLYVAVIDFAGWVQARSTRSTEFVVVSPEMEPVKNGAVRLWSFQTYPQVGAFMEAMEGKDLAYLVHENLNESWSAPYHAEGVAAFSPPRLSYARAANIADDIAENPIPTTTHGVLPDIPDGVWRETVKDFLVGRSFRRDIFVRGPVQLTPA